MATLAAGLLAPIVLRATGLDKKIEEGIRRMPSDVRLVKKQLGFKHGGLVKKTGKALVHKGEFVISKKDVDKLKKAVKKRTVKPRAIKKKSK
tara:strand:+ start:1782 stop:2057 length:276 start_codon:yes stop_codon:yes gene_type:complete